MADEERPVHVVYDCTSGEYTETPLTDEEWEEHKKIAQAASAQAAADAAEEQALRDLVANHSDPVVQALAKRAGLL